ncbi:bifunctional folylpolyglutamate synthase/dihydrofolate synthase [Inediibacterium massiliense]|uniref:bifunctional folylpolyglutamate synthase/dihydrofolate synthase n=1 Tax=Inediibacterium massiliense TaxID=1658111 RepID=UPI0006B51315|nr:folylpolyglutamate synthase/dihydrofolate synthase family protein [Inediibacterium massiliense]
MNYQYALEYIHGTYKFGSKLGLENITDLLKLMENPQKNLKVIHVAGTNGKGSTCNFIHSILKEAGYKVGLYTSPYLEEFTERIQINGINIPKKELGDITSFVKEKVDIMVREGKNHPTEFEIVTAIAFEYFKRESVDFLVLEVGMGGRFDATNVVNSLVSVITSIDYDHMDYLGDTLDKIAYEKAGIIKENSIAVIYPQAVEAMKVIEEVCKKRNTKLIKAPIENIKIINQTEEGQSFEVVINDEIQNIFISMLGDHQIKNSTLALSVIKVLEDEYHISISKKALNEGFRKAIWPGRFEVIRKNPTFVIDGAHNVAGMNALKEGIEKFFKDKNIILGIGILADKDEKMLDIIIPLANKVVITKPNNPRALEVEKLGKKIEKYKKEIWIKENIKDAVDTSLSIANERDVIVFAGSLYMIGEVRSILKIKG